MSTTTMRSANARFSSDHVLSRIPKVDFLATLFQNQRLKNAFLLMYEVAVVWFFC